MTLPDDVARWIDTLQGQCERIRDARSPDQRRASITMATRLADRLRQCREELEQLLREGDQWIATNPNNETAEELRANEDQWLEWLATYETIWDALTSAAQTAFGPASSDDAFVQSGMEQIA